MSTSSASAVRPQLTIGIFLDSPAMARSLEQHLSRDRYTLHWADSEEAFFQLVEQEKQQLDCLVLQQDARLRSLIRWLYSQATVLPLVIVDGNTLTEPDLSELSFMYHTAEIILPLDEMDQISRAIDHAIAAFLKLSPGFQLPRSSSPPDLTRELSTQNFLMLQQRRLADKLKERLGYLGVYYKRDPQNFFRHLPVERREQFLSQLKIDYRAIVLSYFLAGEDLNQKIDNFVNDAFFADISVSQIVEIHMEIMDEFAKQLKLEGRSEEILLDYRLTLIDTIAHLCEMYRRSIPRDS